MSVVLFGFVSVCVHVNFDVCSLMSKKDDTLVCVV